MKAEDLFGVCCFVRPVEVGQVDSSSGIWWCVCEGCGSEWFEGEPEWIADYLTQAVAARGSDAVMEDLWRRSTVRFVDWYSFYDGSELYPIEEIHYKYHFEVF